MTERDASTGQIDHDGLLNLVDAIHRVAQYSRQGREVFMTRPIVQEAVLRNLEIVGDSVKRLSEPTKAAHPDIPWKRLAEMSDNTIHEHFVGNLERVWQAVEEDLPALRQAVEPLLKTERAGRP